MSTRHLSFRFTKTSNIKREALESDLASVPIHVIFVQPDFPRLRVNGI